MIIVGYQPYEDLGNGLVEHSCEFLCRLCNDGGDATPLRDIDVDEDAACDNCFAILRGEEGRTTHASV